MFALSWSARHKKLALPLLVLLLVAIGLFQQYRSPLNQSKTTMASFDELPKSVENNLGEASDPVNIVVVGGEADLRQAFADARWAKADPINLFSAAKIAWYSLFSQYYAQAPMSNLYLFGRPQDLAFQKPGADIRRRDHVRFWRTDLVAGDGREVLVAAATYDDNITLDSRTFFFPTHSISPDIDRERDTVVADLTISKEVEGTLSFPSRPPVKNGRAGPNRFFTDGVVKVILLK